MLRFLSLLIVVIFASAAEGAATTTPCVIPLGALENNMANRVVLTDKIKYRIDAGSLAHMDADHHFEAKVSLEYALSKWQCATWDVELLLPPDVQLNTGTAKQTASSWDSTISYEIEFLLSREGDDRHMDLHQGEQHEYKGVLAIRVFAGGTTPLAPREASKFWDGEGRFHFPILFIIQRTE